MQGWKKGTVPVSKGTRKPRSSSNQNQKQEQNGRRHLILLQGGDPESITHSPPPRRGSRPRRRSFRASKGDPLSRIILDEISNWRLEAERDAEDLTRDTDSGTVLDKAKGFNEQAPSEGILSDEKPYIWGMEDFTPEARLKDDQDRAARQLSSTERLKLRKDMEISAQRFQKNRCNVQNITNRQQRSKRISRISLRDQADSTPNIQLRVGLKSSHNAALRKK